MKPPKERGSGRGAWSEARLHGWIRSLSGTPDVRATRGHDAAILRVPSGRVVACVDQTIEGVHVAPGTAAGRVGRKAVDRALSDLAATAAQPLACLLAVAAPASEREARLRAIIRAARARTVQFGAELVGGDLAASEGPLALGVTALGLFEKGRRPPGRDRARVGEIVVLTGPVGGSGLGRHLAIEPRLEAGRWLLACGATAMIDVSDGLAIDAGRLAASSGVGIDLLEVPLHRDARRAALRSGRSALEHALSDGEDHELLATLPARARARLERERARCCPELRLVGEVRRGRGLRVRDPEGNLEPWRGYGGWVHGG